MIQDIVKQLDPLPPKSKLVIFGGGFSGQRIASVGRHLGVKVLCSRRKKNSKGADFIFNTDKELSNEIFEGATHVLSCIPPLLSGEDPVLNKTQNSITKFKKFKVGWLLINYWCIWRYKRRMGK